LSFSVFVNHRNTYTGITDEDRALTIRELARAAATPNRTEFAEEFWTLGHIPILKVA
jgi:3,4-dihydroxy 2-butanone 4-phosphate synthase